MFLLLNIRIEREPIDFDITDVYFTRTNSISCHHQKFAAAEEGIKDFFTFIFTQKDSD